MGFAHERVGLQGSARRSFTARDEGLCRHRDAEDVFRGPVTECLRPVLHHAAQRTALHAMKRMF